LTRGLPGLAALAYAGLLLGFGRLVVLPAASHLPPGATGADPALAIAVPVLMTAAHAVVLVALAPCLARPALAPDPRAWALLGALIVGGLGALVAVLPLGRALASAAVLAGFAVGLLALRDLARGIGVGETPARLVPIGLGVLLLTTFAWSGPWIEALDDPAAGVAAAVRVNPLAAVAGGVLEWDWGRARPVTYDLFVGQYYPYRYASPGAAVASWLGAGGLLAAASLGLALLRRRREVPRAAPSG
jgi:hypothetical protein